jgi:hypothetical protein
VSVLHPELEQLKLSATRPGRATNPPDRVAFLEARKKYRFARACRSWDRDLGQPVRPDQERPAR